MDGWGDQNGAFSHVNNADALTAFIFQFGKIRIGRPGRSLSILPESCLNHILPASGPSKLLPTLNSVVNIDCMLPVNLQDTSQRLTNELAGNLIALELNIESNLKYRNRMLGTTSLRNFPLCASDVKDYLGGDATVYHLLFLAHQYLGGKLTGIGADFGENLNTAISALNGLWIGCTGHTACKAASRNGDYQISDQDSLAIYPNPSNGVVTLFCWSETSDHLSITITGMDGRHYGALYKSLESGDNYLTLNLESLPAGIYQVMFTKTNGEKTPLKLVYCD